jgi:ribosomal protein L7/L12
VSESEQILDLQRRLALVERGLGQLFEHLDLAPGDSAASEGGLWGGKDESGAPDPAADPEIQDLVAKGNKVQAIKRYRQLTGLGLAEAKDAIDAIG